MRNLGILGLITSFLLATQSGFSAGTVTNCTEADLWAAIEGGGIVTFACDGPIVLTNTITVSVDTTLDANEHLITINGGNAVRLFNVGAGASLTLKNLTLINGRAKGLDGEPQLDGGEGRGGAILVAGGELTLIGCQISTNSAVGGKGGDGNLDFRGTRMSFGSGGAAFAGAIYLDGGVLNATNCEFLGNIARGGNGGVTASSIFPRPARKGGNASGGAIFNHGGRVNLNYCTFSMNTVVGGAAPYNPNDSYADISGQGMGGALFSDAGEVVVTNCSFTFNECSSTESIPTVQGGTGAATSGGAIYSVGGDFLIAATRFYTNKVFGGDESEGIAGEGLGGALFNASQMKVTGCDFIGNQAQGGGYDHATAANGNGGAIVNGGSLQIENSLFQMNNAKGGHSYKTASGQGGAVHNTNHLTVVSSSFDRNIAQGVTGEFEWEVPPPAFGGALFTLQSCSLTNVTFSENAALGGNVHGTLAGYSETPGTAYGGAIFVTGNATLFLGNCTLSGNQAIGGKGRPGRNDGIGFGGGICATNATPDVVNTILVDNTKGSNFFGTLSDLGHNLSSDSSCNFSGPGSLNNANPKLGAFEDYGGLTPTFPLLAGSPAIDGGDNANAPAHDQRGRTRPFGANSDIGAFESSPPYVILGKISGTDLATEVSITIGEESITTTNNGYFRITGLMTGSYPVSPTSADYVFSPSNHLVTVGPDRLDVNFKAYRWNTLNLDDVSGNQAHLVYAGTNGNTLQLLSSSNLVDWLPVSTNAIEANNLVDLFVPVPTATPTRFFRSKQTP